MGGNERSSSSAVSLALRENGDLSAGSWRTYEGQTIAGKQKETTPGGFEPPRAKPSGFQVHPVNHSGTVSVFRDARKCRT